MYILTVSLLNYEHRFLFLWVAFVPDGTNLLHFLEGSFTKFHYASYRLIRSTGKHRTISIVSGALATLSNILIALWTSGTSEVELWSDVVPGGFGMFVNSLRLSGSKGRNSYQSTGLAW